MCCFSKNVKLVADTLSECNRLDTKLGVLFASWIATWWFLRAACQFYLGRRRGDWIIFTWFSLLSLLHVFAATHTS